MGIWEEGTLGRRKARMLVWALKCVTGICDTAGAWRPAGALIHPQVAVSFLPQWELLAQVPEQCWLLSHHQTGGLPAT